MHHPADGGTTAAPWLHSVPSSDPDVQRARRFAVLALTLFAAVTWFAVPHGIGFSWRECDTQAIARNFLQDGFDPLRPRVDWRGDTDGAVECEFPLYQLSIASLLAFVGSQEWPGRLLSLLAIVWAGLSIHRLFEQRAGPGAALAGLLVFLSSGCSVMLATRVMPDAFSLALGCASLAAFARYLSNGSSLSLWLSMIALTFGALQKPLALQLGIVMFGWTCFVCPQRLKEPRLWLGFALVVGTVLAWLLHGRALHEETGLTFGVTSGGDTKFPSLEHLTTPKIHAQLAWTSVQYGMSVLGGLGALALLIQRRMRVTDLVLLGAIAIGLYISLRYSYHHSMGPHYHMFAAVGGAWCVARAWPPQASRGLWTVLLVAICLQATWRVQFEHRKRTVMLATPLMDVAKTIRDTTGPEDRMIVRSKKPRHDVAWNRRNNFENPAMLYQSQRRGWVVPTDEFDARQVERLWQQGARLVCDPVKADISPSLSRWLREHSEPILESRIARVYRLKSLQ